MPGNILLVDPSNADILYGPLESGLHEHGHSVLRYRSVDHLLSESRARESADVMFGLGAPFTREVMAAMPRLRAVMSPVTGTDGIDERAATELGIVVGNCQIPENTESMAEAAVMLMLVCLYDLRGSEMILREERPHPNPVSAQMAKNKLIGLIGFGQIAQAIARRLEGWDVRIQTYTPRLRTPLPSRVTRVELDELMHTSDVIIVLCPLNQETRGMLHAQRLRLMKPGAIFVNIARGGIADEAELYELTRRGHVRSIAVDVFAVEPPPRDNPLRLLPERNAILTPHLVGHTAEVIARLPITSIESVDRIMSSQPPVYVRNPDVLPGWLRRWA